MTFLKREPWTFESFTVFRAEAKKQFLDLRDRAPPPLAGITPDHPLALHLAHQADDVRQVRHIISNNSDRLDGVQNILTARFDQLEALVTTYFAADPTGPTAATTAAAATGATATCADAPTLLGASGSNDTPTLSLAAAGGDGAAIDALPKSFPTLTTIGTCANAFELYFQGRYGWPPLKDVKDWKVGRKSW